MIGTLRSLLVLTMVGAVAAVAAPAATAGQTQTYIVVLRPGGSPAGSEAAALARRYGGDVGFVYETALRGFSITASSAAASALARNPRVSYVEADQPVAVDAQTTPTGLGRIGAPGNTEIGINGADDQRVDVDVAVIDTGIDLDHPDLNVVGGVNCLTGSCVTGGDDDHYHGTHVAGTVAALDNGLGVVGVAPGARLWAVKVLNRRGSGSWAVVIAGIDWVAAHASTVEVANMSLGGGKSTAVNQAVAGAVAAGVTMVVAAGNESADADGYSPASEPTAITVSALADFNGAAGGGAASTCYPDVDDTFAGFSNYGAAVDIIAPGVCIYSTSPGGGYRTLSGTSMASPHVAGAAALLRSMGKSLATTRADLLSLPGNQSWSGDPDPSHEPLLDVSSTTVFNPTLVPVSGGGGGNVAPTASFTSSCSGLTCDFTSTSTDPEGGPMTYAWSFGDGSTSTDGNPSHTFAAGSTYTVGLTVTDNGGATGSTTQPVTVTAPPSGGLTFTGGATSQKSTWTARVNVSGATPGSVVAGTWAVGGSSSSGSCTASTSGTCTISKRKVSNTISSVTWTHGGSPASVVSISGP